MAASSPLPPVFRRHRAQASTCVSAMRVASTAAPVVGRGGAAKIGRAEAFLFSVLGKKLAPGGKVNSASPAILLVDEPWHWTRTIAGTRPTIERWCAVRKRSVTPIPGGSAPWTPVFALRAALFYCAARQALARRWSPHRMHHAAPFGAAPVTATVITHFVRVET